MSALKSRWVGPLCAVVAVISLGACSDNESASDVSSSTTESAVLPFEARDPAVIVQAVTAAGVQICGELLLPIPNEGYRYEDTRKLTLTVEGGACHTSISEMEAEPSHGYLNLERFTSASERDVGVSVHREEVVTGTAQGDYNPAKVMWAYGEYLVVLSHGTTADVEALVTQALLTVPDATHVYSSPAATPR